MNNLSNELRATYQSGVTQPIEWRITQLNALHQLVEENKQALFDAVKEDLGRCAYETNIGELMNIKTQIKCILSNLRHWMAPRSVSTPLLHGKGLSTSHIIPQPLGVVLIITPWNYPISLPLDGIAYVIASGNCAVVKPSEISERCSALLNELIPKYLDNNCVKVVLGGVPETTELLKQRWDHILYTGNGVVGKVILRAAAEFLTPTTLELGGKSPVVVDRNVSMGVALKRIAWGKFLNCGQTCIAPDYVLVHKDVKDEFINGLKDTITSFYKDPKTSEDYGRIVSERHAKRLATLLDADRDKIIYGGDVDLKDKYISPTLLYFEGDAINNSQLMHEEIFGPILPIISVDSLEDSVTFINQRPKPLALYLFSKDDAMTQLFISRTSSGGLCVNDTLCHFSVPDLPFGGVGDSGFGGYHGQTGFDRFSHLRAILNKTTIIDPSLRYPPYDYGNVKILGYLAP
eukprot:TRINITY_DN1296_c0_g1_i2.p1 TRINITY_DN1296_c0_g1~~TRINITY_DN1296_c0_g1_i2.p1  ORF type:complete len:511 (-),score=87.97 TRINITY_DN1296_c0_g1_i2:106-1488(-)